MKRSFLLAAGFAALVLYACGGGGGGSTTPSTTAPTTSATPASTPQEATVAGSPAFVSSSNGHTLYVFSIDGKNVSNCGSSNGCSAIWVPYSAPSGTTAPANTGFAIFTRSDGTQQWSYSGAPLYTYTGDSGADEDNGQGLNEFGGLWGVARPPTATSQPTSNPY